jgi:flap endonuclease-1
MGVTGFTKFYKQVVHNEKNEHSMNHYEGKIIIVDAMQKIFKLCIGHRGKKGSVMTKSNGKEIDHIFLLFVFTMRLLNLNITPVYVFDGKNPTEKFKSTQERNKYKSKALNNCDIIEDKTSIDYKKNLKRSFHLTSEMIDDCKTLLNLMGVPVVESIGEADQQCAALSVYYNKQVAGVMTEDTDTLVFGGDDTKIIKNFSFRENKIIEVKKRDIMEYLFNKTNEILHFNNKKKISHFTHENFINFSILMGTDYTNKDDGTTCKLKYIKHEELFEVFVLNDFSIADTIGNIKEKGVEIPNNFMPTMDIIKKIYTDSKVINPSKIDIHLKQINFKGLTKFLCDFNEVDICLIKKYLTVNVPFFMKYINYSFVE